MDKLTELEAFNARFKDAESKEQHERRVSASAPLVAKMAKQLKNEMLRSKAMEDIKDTIKTLKGIHRDMKGNSDFFRPDSDAETIESLLECSRILKSAAQKIETYTTY